MGARVTAVGVVASLAAVFAMAIDHLVGTDDGDEERFAEPGVFVGTAAAAVAATGLLFRYLVWPATQERDRASTKAIACSLLAVLSLPLLFLAVPFPLAGAGLALGLIGRQSRRRAVATAAAVLGGAVLALGVGAYVFALAQ